MLATYFDELGRHRRKQSRQSSRGLQPSSPHEVVITEEEVDEDE